MFRFYHFTNGVLMVEDDEDTSNVLIKYEET